MKRARTHGDHDSDVCRLHSLLRTLSDLITELDFTKPDGSRNEHLDRVSDLARLAEDLAERLADEVENGLPQPQEG